MLLEITITIAMASFITKTALMPPLEKIAMNNETRHHGKTGNENCHWGKNGEKLALSA